LGSIRLLDVPVLFPTFLPFCFPAILAIGAMPHFPDAFWVVALTVLAVFLGQILQAISSLLEPVLFWSWGGRPSDRALTKGLKGYLPKDAANAIKQTLDTAARSNGHGTFLFAMQKADSSERTRTPRFNAL